VNSYSRRDTYTTHRRPIPRLMGGGAIFILASTHHVAPLHDSVPPSHHRSPPLAVLLNPRATLLYRLRRPSPPVQILWLLHPALSTFPGDRLLISHTVESATQICSTREDFTSKPLPHTSWPTDCQAATLNRRHPHLSVISARNSYSSPPDLSALPPLSIQSHQ
jgi:hypothetical protein